MNQLIRTAGAVAMAGICLIALSSCDNNLARGPMAVSLQDGHLAVAFCAEATVKSIVGQDRVGGGAWKTFWDLHGKAAVEVGSIFEVEMGLPGLSGEATEPSLGSEHKLIFLVKQSDGHSYLAGFSGVSSRALAGGRWLQPDGTSTASPCQK